MPRYEGAVTIVTPDGDVVEDVRAALVSVEAENRWFGKIQGSFDAFDLMDGVSTLRLPDGSEGSFRLTRTDLVVARQGVEIEGVDAAPF